MCVGVCFRAEQIQRNPFGFLSLRAGARGLLCNWWVQTPLVSCLSHPRLQRNPQWGTVTCLLSPNLEAHPSSHRGQHLGFPCVWVLERRSLLLWLCCLEWRMSASQVCWDYIWCRGNRKPGKPGKRGCLLLDQEVQRGLSGEGEGLHDALREQVLTASLRWGSPGQPTVSSSVVWQTP